MYGPTGIGVLYGKKEKLEKLEPFFFGGEMIKEVNYETSTWADLPAKFEGGTPNIAGAIGLAAAVDFINELGYETIVSHEQELVSYLFKKLPLYIKVIGPTHATNRAGIVSFSIEGIHPQKYS
jgi:cysteine desulfurase/selenocysteine lyase